MRIRLRSISKTFGFVVLLLFHFPFVSAKQAYNKPTSKDSLAYAPYIDKCKGYFTEFPFIRYDKNFIEWKNISSISNFFSKLQKSPTQRVKILHIGDSHIQADIFTGRLRNKMQELFGYGGRGMVFPYKAAKTHAAIDYRTYCEGKWEHSRNVIPEDNPIDMGISGVSIRTYDSTASFKIVFLRGMMRDEFKTIKIYLKKSPNCFNFKMRSYSSDIPIYLESDTIDKKPYIKVDLPNTCDTIEIIMNKTDSSQHYFECYGIMIESNEEGGILYNSVGINGAGYKSILRQTLMGDQLSELKPDLVIIDLGANDFYRAPFNATELEFNLKTIIQIIKGASPQTSIIVSNSQDIYYRRKNIIACKSFSELTRKVAFENDCAFYDYYNISGGQFSMLKWLRIHFAKRDKVHLTNEGYYLKAELWYNAFLNSYSEFLKQKGNRSLLTENLEYNSSIVFADTNKKTDIIKKNEASPDDKLANEDENQTVYVVKHGDVLRKIAAKYAVTISQISKWNHLKKNKIVAGQKLYIYSSQHKIIPKTKTVQSNTKVLPKSQSVYIVVSGDNLSGIARKFHITVDVLKKLNKLTDDKLHPGDKLKVK
ncbi:MAG: LysM peptidoglycan-binding domain-containing protein [Bacteroidota bacterium]